MRTLELVFRTHSRSFAPLPTLSALVLTALVGVGCATGGMSSATASLEGTNWHFATIHGLVAPDEDGAHPHIRIDSSAGRVVGDTGCNTFNGPYRADGARLIMGPLAVTRRACAGAVGEFEEHVLEAIRQTTLYRIQGSQLFLYPDSESPAHARLEAAE